MIITSIGKPNKEYQTHIQCYIKRIQHYRTITLQHLKDMPQYSNPSERKKQETLQILGTIKPKEYPIILSPEGAQYTSEKFALKVQEWTLNGSITPHFCIAGAYGFTHSLLQVQHQKLSLGSMTFTHDITLLILLEQIYRAYTILHNVPYHH